MTDIREGLEERQAGAGPPDGSLTDVPSRGETVSTHVPLSSQPTAPYLEAVSAYGFRGSTRFHVPGHKGGEGADPGMRTAFGDQPLLLDVPQDIEGIDIGVAPTPYEQAERLAAEAYRAERAWFLTNGATQGNHALCLALAPPHSRVVMQRNSHASMIDGLILSGGVPTWVAPEYDPELGMAHGVTPDSLEAALARTPDARTAFIVSPTYYGMAADVGGCAEACHRAGVALVVDNAWGAHFGFHPRLPPSPLDLGADAMLASTHKIVGSLTQSAMLLVAGSERLDAGAIARAVRLVRSTSPSSLLMASLDAARRQLAVHGEALLEQTIQASETARRELDAVPGVSVVGDGMVGQAGVAGWDPLRIVIDVRDTGCTGYEVAAALRSSYDIHVELATHATLVLVLGIGQKSEPLQRFAHDFAEAVREISRPGRATALTRAPSALELGTSISPRDAFLGEGETVPVERAEGRISCESIAGYPPGIPALLPGERITAEVIAYLRELTSAGARLHGAADPTFASVRVLVETPR